MDDIAHCLPQDEGDLEGGSKSAVGRGEDVVEAVAFEGDEGDRFRPLGGDEVEELVAVGRFLVVILDDVGQRIPKLGVEGIEIADHVVGDQAFADEAVCRPIGGDHDVRARRPNPHGFKGQIVARENP